MQTKKLVSTSQNNQSSSDYQQPNIELELQVLNKKEPESRSHSTRELERSAEGRPVRLVIQKKLEPAEKSALLSTRQGSQCGDRTRVLRKLATAAAPVVDQQSIVVNSQRMSSQTQLSASTGPAVAAGTDPII